MVYNDNHESAVNDFSQQVFIPNQIVTALIKNTSQEAENFWKLLYYSQPDALTKPNLTTKQKTDMIWTGQTEENKYHVFYKPLIGAALDTANSQTQIRLYRTATNPTTRLSAITNFEIDLITNEKESLIRYGKYFVERTDLMESFLLAVINGRDIGIGIGRLKFDKEPSHSCSSVLGINNSKTFYGRSLVLGLRFMSAETDITACG